LGFLILRLGRPPTLIDMLPSGSAEGLIAGGSAAALFVGSFLLTEFLPLAIFALLLSTRTM